MNEMSVAGLNTPRVRSERRHAALSLAIVGMGVLLAVVLALPGQTITTKYVNDLFIFLDGAYRIVQGQVPNRDFHSSLGPLAFYLPAIGYLLTGSLGAAMPASMALAVVVLALLAARVIGARMEPAIGLPLAGFLLLIAAVPLNPGEGVTDLSFAMFYNRLGWVGLGLLFVFYLPAQRGGTSGRRLDALCAAVLVLFLLYLKVSYGLVAIAFLLLLLTQRETRKLAAVALLGCLASVIVVELVWRGTAGYLLDLQVARDVSGDLPDFRRLTTIIMQNLADVAVYLIFAAVLIMVRRRFRDLLFAGFCGATGVLIIEQNFQIVGILTLTAGAAVMASASDMQGYRHRTLAAGLPLLLAIMLVPVSIHNGAALALHTGLGLMQKGEQMPMPGYDRVRLVQLSNDGLYRNFSRYNQSLADGAAALASLEQPAERVIVFDFVDPFTAGLGLVSPRGDYPWYHWGRTINDDVYPAAEDILFDAQVIMVPRQPIEFWTATGLSRVYAPYLEQNFRLVQETPFWRIYRRTGNGSGSPANSTVTRQSTSAQP